MVTSSNPHAAIPQKDPRDAPLKDHPDTTAWLTREQSAHLLGVSVQTIRNYEKRELLFPQRLLKSDTKGRKQVVVVHDPRALSELHKTLKDRTRNDTTADTSTWYTRNESVDFLRVSTQTLKNYERQGKLHPLHVPREDARGHKQVVVVYDPKELARLPRGIGVFATRKPGELQARCYELFEQGKSFREIVVELRETSDTIRDLHERWLDDAGSRIVISDTARTALTAVLGPFEDVTALVDLVIANSTAK